MDEVVAKQNELVQNQKKLFFMWQPIVFYPSRKIKYVYEMENFDFNIQEDLESIGESESSRQSVVGLMSEQSLEDIQIGFKEIPRNLKSIQTFHKLPVSQDN